MAVTIRLMRFGKKGYPTYRIVVVDKRKKPVGSYIEKIGTYTPMNTKNQLTIDKGLFDKWISKGATLSEGMQKLLHK